MSRALAVEARMVKAAVMDVESFMLMGWFGMIDQCLAVLTRVSQDEDLLGFVILYISWLVAVKASVDPFGYDVLHKTST